MEQRVSAAMERRLLRLAKEQEAAADLQLVTEQEQEAAAASPTSTWSDREPSPVRSPPPQMPTAKAIPQGLRSEEQEQEAAADLRLAKEQEQEAAAACAAADACHATADAWDAAAMAAVAATDSSRAASSVPRPWAESAPWHCKAAASVPVCDDWRAETHHGFMRIRTTLSGGRDGPAGTLKRLCLAFVPGANVGQCRSGLPAEPTHPPGNIVPGGSTRATELARRADGSSPTLLKELV